MNIQMANAGTDVITLVMQAGARFNLRPGFWVEVEQNHNGQFLRVVAYGCVVLK